MNGRRIDTICASCVANFAFFLCTRQRLPLAFITSVFGMTSEDMQKTILVPHEQYKYPHNDDGIVRMPPWFSVN